MFVGPLIHSEISRRSKPYERPRKRSPKPTTTAATPGQFEADQTTADILPEASKAKQPDATTVTRLFQLLLPIMVKEPLTFESKASAICAALDLDPVTATDIINAVKQNMSGGSKAE
jgi:hypothetical protein